MPYRLSTFFWGGTLLLPTSVLLIFDVSIFGDYFEIYFFHSWFMSTSSTNVYCSSRCRWLCQNCCKRKIDKNVQKTCIQIFLDLIQKRAFSRSVQLEAVLLKALMYFEIIFFTHNLYPHSRPLCTAVHGGDDCVKIVARERLTRLSIFSPNDCQK